MAKTKFLDYTGLAKLVEKIKNTYVNIGGSTMTGTLKTLENQPAINFRPNNSGYSVTLNYDTESAEALAINLKNPATSFMINSGVDGTTWTGEGHQSKVTPTIQVRKNCVAINKYIADNITSEYKLDVNGDVKANSFTGKLGTDTIGSATKPMYLSGGTPTECTYTLAQNVTSASKLTDTTYSASTGLSLSKDNKFSINAATSSTIGGVKIGSGITVDTGGTISLTKTNVTNALGYTPPTADTNTHYTTGLIVGNSSSSTGNTAVTTNGVFLNLKDDNHIRNSHKIVGGGATTVTSDSGGTITISSTAYKDATISERGLMTAADKVKLNSLAKVATSGSYADLSNKPTIPTSLPANGGKADSATQDSSGQKITSTYIKGLSVNGTTITYTKGDNSSGTINTQDTNTTYTFTNGTDGTFTVKASNSTKAQTISVGKTASASTADNAVNAQTAETANKLSVNAGSDMTPIYFKDGVPKPCDSTLGVNISGSASTASLASKLSVGAGSGSGNNVLLLGNYEGGPIFMGGGVGPGEFTPTDIIAKDGDYYRLNVSKANTANSATTATSAITATYAKKYSYNGIDRDFLYDVVEGGNHYIKCNDTTIITKKGKNINNYDFVLNPDGKGGCYIYDGPNAKGAFWGIDGMVFDKAPANSLVAANGTFATAISDTDIKNAINSAIDWTQSL